MNLFSPFFFDRSNSNFKFQLFAGILNDLFYFVFVPWFENYRDGIFIELRSQSK